MTTDDRDLMDWAKKYNGVNELQLNRSGYIEDMQLYLSTCAIRMEKNGSEYLFNLYRDKLIEVRAKLEDL